MSPLLGRGDDVNPLQFIARVILLMSIVPILGVVRASEPCYPTCTPTAKQIAAAQSSVTTLQSTSTMLSTNAVGDATAVTSPTPATLLPAGPITVAVYGDSRAFSFAEGARLVPGWTVDNYGIPTCPWLNETDAFSWSGNSACDTAAYVEQTGHHALAIVYSGGILANPRLTQPVNDITANLVASLSLVNADVIVVLATPQVYGEALHNGYPEDFADIDASLAAAAATVGAVWLPGFATWADEQGESCQPDGVHFTLECATKAAMFIAANVR